ncbi:RimK/LysX family protein [uncultured Tolumonas sp.]|uniref:retropepsin-like aspartic peptidase RloA3 n=1 Tax=uncultured Tolumonas sp. TaxID=263765 RepID=UPI002A0A3260|nr:RimK/LysX family protein [uncultured Tolumonas sp.]
MQIRTILVAMMVVVTGMVNAAEPVQGRVASAPPKVFGWVEKAVLLPGALPLNVKMDTGALTSSLDARDLERFRKDGRDWVRFVVEVQDDHDQPHSMSYEREVQRDVLLRGAGGADHRPAVLMQICIGDQVYEEQFTLRDRGDMKYPVLIGRRTIEHLGLIDVKQQYTVEPKCPAG